MKFFAMTLLSFFATCALAATQAEIDAVKQAAFPIFEEKAKEVFEFHKDRFPGGIISSVDPRAEFPLLDFEVNELKNFNTVRNNGLRRFSVNGILRILDAQSKIHYFNGYYTGGSMFNWSKARYVGSCLVRALVDLNENGEVVRAEFSDQYKQTTLMSGESAFPPSPWHESLSDNGFPRRHDGK